MARKQAPSKTRRVKPVDYQVTVTAPRMRTVVKDVKASSSAEARREAKKVFREEKPAKAPAAHYSARRVKDE